ncbi:MAG: hypothetical protein CML29_16350 [Rhizobiales bacterium]|nr:hypothetical protein [Hyphomicrobiales bacterium]MBA68698.1 hypothetical protein [Hyphomicrobiales bacterium]|tara:strand:+ start:460 stop:1659 length:1200 start_codon:yes stop_codon:yes gene_type:complete
MHLSFNIAARARLPLAALLLAGTALPAWALDGEAFAAKVNEAYAVSGASIEYDSADVSGSTVTLTNAKLMNPGAPALEAGDLVFDGVEETSDGGYTADTLVIEDIDYTKDDTRLTVSDMEMTGLVIPAEPGTGSLDDLFLYDGFTTGPVSVSSKGDEVFSMAGFDGKLSRLSGDAGIEFTGTANGMKVHYEGIDDPKAKKTLNDLGYEELTGSAKMALSWELESGRVDMREFSMTMDDAGRFNIALDLSGYTMEFVKAMQQAQETTAKNPDPEAAKQAQGLMMLGMLQQLTLNSAEITFEDASLTGRVLDYFGRQQGISGDQMGDAVKGMLPLMLGQLGIPALQQQISAAANTFVDNPESLRVSAEPAEPVPFSQIVGVGMSDPRQLADLLEVKVTAND